MQIVWLVLATTGMPVGLAGCTSSTISRTSDAGAGQDATAQSGLDSGSESVLTDASDGGAADVLIEGDANVESGPALAADASVDASTDGSSSGGNVDASDAGPPDACIDGTCDAGCTDLSTDVNCGACGYACVDGRHCASGRCTPAWLPMTSVNAPTARANFQGAALAGTLIVAGGSGPVANCSGSLASAAQYDPSTDVWTTLPSLNSARSQHSIVSSGTAIYAFDGLTDCSNGFTQLGSLESWAPGEAAWTIVNGSNPPAARYAQESTWTGSMLWIYGGASGALSYVTSGSLYDPVQNVWSDASCVLANCARNDGATILDQGYVRLWGGGGGTAPAGLAYEISTGFWAAWTIPANFPATLTNPADDGRRIYLPSGGGSSNLNIVIYDRQTQSQTTDTATSPIDMSSSGAMVWTGAEVVVWSGAGGTAPTSAGGRYQPPAPQE